MELFNKLIINEILPIVFEINNKNKFRAKLEFEKNFVWLWIFKEKKVVKGASVNSFSKFIEYQNMLNLAKLYNEK